MRLRLSPSFIVAVLALIVATAGVGYAAASAGRSPDDRTSTVQARGLAKCPSGSLRLFGTCMQKSPKGPTSWLNATKKCSGRNGRLPSLAELKVLALRGDITWANGMPNQYEYSSDADPATGEPVARDRGGNIFSDATGQQFYYHCMVAR